MKVFKTEWRKRETAVCVVCQNPFQVVISELKRGKGKCCSISCRSALSARFRNQKGAANNNWKGGHGVPARKLRYKSANPEKHKAHLALTRAIRRGDLVRMPCEKCGALRVEGHHDDYSLPLVVRWLCKSHHLDVHGGRFKSASQYQA